MMMNLINEYEFEITELDKNSFHLIEELLIESGLISEEFLGGENDSIAKLKHKFHRNHAKVFVCIYDGMIISFVLLVIRKSATSVIEYGLHIAYLYVKPSHRRMHLAKKMLEYVLSFCGKTKAEELSLYTAKDNLPAVELYRAIGFEEHKHLADYVCFKINLKEIKAKRANM